jgi:hypothetical protein
MKKLLLFFSSLILCCYLSVSQVRSEEFLEVTIVDSIQVEAETFTFLLFFYPIESANNDEYKVTQNPAIKFVRNLIKEMKLDTIPDETSFNTEQRNHEQMLIVFKSLNDLKEFSKKVRNNTNVQGFVASRSTSKIKEATHKLYEKLFEKAREEVVLLANKSQRIPDKVIQLVVTDIEENEGGWTAYPPLSALRDLDPGSANLKVVVGRKITLRYSLK